MSIYLDQAHLSPDTPLLPLYPLLPPLRALPPPSCRTRLPLRTSGAHTRVPSLQGYPGGAQRFASPVTRVAWSGPGNTRPRSPPPLVASF